MRKLSFARVAFLLLASLTVVVTPHVRAEAVRYEPNWASLDKRPCPEWYADAKFGIFIHWGTYSVPAWGDTHEYAEWYWNKMHNQQSTNVWWQYHMKNYGTNFDYKDFAPQFHAELFQPDQWADIFKRSGAKYVVLTSKHHEGFCLWPNEDANRTWGRPWNSVVTGPHRDLVGDLGTAVRKAGLKFGLYYSLYEWFNPLYLKDRKAYVTGHMHPQFKDVVSRYQPSLIFADGEWEMKSAQWKSEELLAWLFNESPCKDEVVINDRWGSETRHHHGGYYTTEYGAGMQDASHPWEESRGMAYSYGYNRAESLDDYKSAREFVLTLCDLVSRGGNLLLDIGPAADGTIPVLMQQRLIEIGDWLKVNGEAIYGTHMKGRSCQWSDGARPGQEYGEYKIQYHLMDQIGAESKDGKAVKQFLFTQKSDALYAITTGWYEPKVILRNVRLPRNAVVTMLGVEGKLKYQAKGKDAVIELPSLSPDKLPCQHAWTIKLAGGELLPE